MISNNVLFLEDIFLLVTFPWMFSINNKSPNLKTDLSGEVNKKITEKCKQKYGKEEKAYIDQC